MLSNVTCTPTTPMTFNNSVNLTDQFMLKAGYRYINTKQSMAGMYPVGKSDNNSQIKFDFHTCHSCVPMPQALRRPTHTLYCYQVVESIHL